jgi:hypothetical protein
MATRTRQSIQVLLDEHDKGNTAPLENLIIAFRKIQALPPDNPDSFESIAGYHGEPFTEKPPSPSTATGAAIVSTIPFCSRPGTELLCCASKERYKIKAQTQT